MTECRSCKDGVQEVIETINSAPWPFTVINRVTITCPCCDGKHEDCPTCSREFPNSIEAVQMGNG